MQRSLITIFITAAISLAGAQSCAAPVTFDFNDWQPGLFKSNVTMHGVTFSPSCHFDLAAGIPSIPGSTRWIGFDLSGCIFDSAPIDSYLGAPFAGNSGRLHVSAPAGVVMSLVSLKFASLSDDYGGFSLLSSKGGVTNIGASTGLLTQHNFSGPEWSNLSWLEFDAGAAGEPSGFDDLVLLVHRVDEPSSIALLAVSALGFLGFCRRGNKVPPSSPSRCASGS